MISAAGGAEGSVQDFDLNIAPIIDCFTVLIAYLLISASFVSISFLDVGVSTTVEVAAPSQAPLAREFLAVRIGEGLDLEIQLSGLATTVVQIPHKTGGGADVARLREELGKVRAKWPELSEAAVNGAGQVEYRDMIQVVEALKQEWPKVYVGE